MVMSGSMVLLWLWSVLMSMAHVATKGHMDVCRQCCRLKSCLQVSIYTAMLVSMVWAASEGFVWVCGPIAARAFFCGLCCHQKWHDPCSHWLSRARRLLLLWGRDMEGFFNKHYFPTSLQSNCIDRKPSKRSLKKCDGCWSVALYSSSILKRVQEERIQFYLRSWSLGICSCSSE